LQWHTKVKYVTKVPLVYTYGFMAIDKKTFDAIGDADKAIVAEVMTRTYQEFDKTNLADNQGAYEALLKSGIEAVKFMRDVSWDSNIALLSVGVPYTLVFDGISWKATTTPLFIANQFDRRISLESVYRDDFGNITSSGWLDANTKKVSVTVSWQKDTGTTTKEITTYVSNIFKN